MIGGTSINKCTDSSLILFNTKIYTLNDTYPLAEALVIKDKKIHFGAGAGVVADSIPENEWEECRQKSKVFIDAIEMIL